MAKLPQPEISLQTEAEKSRKTETAWETAANQVLPGRHGLHSSTTMPGTFGTALSCRPMTFSSDRSYPCERVLSVKQGQRIQTDERPQITIKPLVYSRRTPVHRPDADCGLLGARQAGGDNPLATRRRRDGRERRASGSIAQAKQEGQRICRLALPAYPVTEARITDRGCS